MVVSYEEKAAEKAGGRMALSSLLIKHSPALKEGNHSSWPAKTEKNGSTAQKTGNAPVLSAAIVSFQNLAS